MFLENMVETEHKLRQGHVSDLYRDAEVERLVRQARAAQGRTGPDLLRRVKLAGGAYASSAFVISIRRALAARPSSGWTASARAWLMGWLALLIIAALGIAGCSSESVTPPNTTTVLCHSEERSDEESRRSPAEHSGRKGFFAPAGRSE
jgi:hypothetical protein